MSAGVGAPVGGAPGNGPRLKTFAEGTYTYPTPIQGMGGSLTAAAAGGNVSTLTPIPQTGFLGALRKMIAGNLTVGTLGTQYQVPLHRLESNYTLQNSLTYPYRNISGDDIWMWANICDGASGGADAIYGSLNSLQPNVTGTGAKAFSYSYRDQIAMNDGVNFSKFLLSALTNSNTLTINIQWLAQSALAALQSNTVVFSSYTASCAVTAEYQMVPDATKYYWPDVSKVQQVIGDPSFTATAQGQNSINLTPVSGPAYMGIGTQLINANGTPDTLAPGTSGLVNITLLAGGTQPLKVWTLADIVGNYESLYKRSPQYGYAYIDLASDLSIMNVMSALRRKNLATKQYAQLTWQVNTNANFTPGAGSRIGLLKRMYQSYSGNAAVA